MRHEGAKRKMKQRGEKEEITDRYPLLFPSFKMIMKMMTIRTHRETEKERVREKDGEGRGGEKHSEAPDVTQTGSRDREVQETGAQKERECTRGIRHHLESMKLNVEGAQARKTGELKNAKQKNREKRLRSDLSLSLSCFSTSYSSTPSSHILSTDFFLKWRREEREREREKISEEGKTQERNYRRKRQMESGKATKQHRNPSYTWASYCIPQQSGQRDHEKRNSL